MPTCWLLLAGSPAAILVCRCRHVRAVLWLLPGSLASSGIQRAPIQVCDLQMRRISCAC